MGLLSYFIFALCQSHLRIYNDWMFAGATDCRFSLRKRWRFCQMTYDLCRTVGQNPAARRKSSAFRFTLKFREESFNIPFRRYNNPILKLFYRNRYILFFSWILHFRIITLHRLVYWKKVQQNFRTIRMSLRFAIYCLRQICFNLANALDGYYYRKLFDCTRIYLTT